MYIKKKFFCVLGGRLGELVNVNEQMAQMACLLFKENICAKLFIAQTPTQTNVSNDTTTLQGEHLCKIILKSMHKCKSPGQDKLNL